MRKGYKPSSKNKKDKRKGYKLSKDNEVKTSKDNEEGIQTLVKKYNKIQQDTTRYNKIQKIQQNTKDTTKYKRYEDKPSKNYEDKPRKTTRKRHKPSSEEEIQTLLSFQKIREKDNKTSKNNENKLSYFSKDKRKGYKSSLKDKRKGDADC